jgi:hypothetical protein
VLDDNITEKQVNKMETFIEFVNGEKVIHLIDEINDKIILKASFDGSVLK